MQYVKRGVGGVSIPFVVVSRGAENEQIQFWRRSYRRARVNWELIGSRGALTIMYKSETKSFDVKN